MDRDNFIFASSDAAFIRDEFAGRRFAKVVNDFPGKTKTIVFDRPPSTSEQESFASLMMHGEDISVFCKGGKTTNSELQAALRQFEKLQEWRNIPKLTAENLNRIYQELDVKADAEEKILNRVAQTKPKLKRSSAWLIAKQPLALAVAAVTAGNHYV